MIGALLAALAFQLAFPQPPRVYLSLAALWLIYLSCQITVSERTLLVFIVLLPAMEMVPWTAKLVPGLNFGTVIVPALGLAAFVSHQTDPRPSSNPFVAPALFYAAVLIVSASFSYMLGTTRSGLWSLFSSIKSYIFFVFLAPIAFRLVWNRNLLHSMVQLIAWTTTLVSLHSLWMLQRGESRFGDRAAGIIGQQPNLFGGFLAMMTVLFGSLLLSGNLKGRQRLLYATALVSSGAALLATMSRGSWIGALAGLLYVGLSRGARGVAVLLVLAMSATIWVPEAVFERARETIPEDSPYETQLELELEPSAQVRLLQWKALPKMWIQSPLLGHGFNSYGRLYAPYDPRRRSKPPHSSIIELTVEEGLAGLLAYCWLIWALGRGAWKVSRNSEEPFQKALSAGFVAALICLVLLDTSGTRFLDNTVMAYMWLLGGAISRTSWNLENETLNSVDGGTPASVGKTSRWQRHSPRS